MILFSYGKCTRVRTTHIDRMYSIVHLYIRNSYRRIHAHVIKDTNSSAGRKGGKNLSRPRRVPVPISLAIVACAAAGRHNVEWLRAYSFIKHSVTPAAAAAASTRGYRDRFVLMTSGWLVGWLFVRSFVIRSFRTLLRCRTRFVSACVCVSGHVCSCYAAPAAAGVSWADNINYLCHLTGVKCVWRSHSNPRRCRRTIERIVVAAAAAVAFIVETM